METEILIEVSQIFVSFVVIVALVFMAMGFGVLLSQFLSGLFE